MAIALDPAPRRRILSADSHYYRKPTSPLYLDRVLPCHDVIYLENGKWVFTENETDYPMGRGDVLILAGGYHHYTRLPCAPDTRTVCLHVEKLEGDREDTPGALILPTLLHAGTYPGVKELFHEIVRAAWQKEAGAGRKMSALFDLLILELARIANEGETEQLSNELIRMISDSPGRAIRAGEAADELNVSVKTINSAMKARTGMTFAAYQAEERLRHAERLLVTEPDMKLGEIASTLGFTDEFHMSKAFKARYGVSPSVYRMRETEDGTGNDAAQVTGVDFS